MVAAAIYGTLWGKNRKEKENKTGMLGFTVPHEFLIQHGSIACASCCSFCLVAWFTQRKGNETKVCITSDMCMSVRTARSGRESSARMPANARASDWISGRGHRYRAQ